jgi:hypothetical protein
MNFKLPYFGYLEKEDRYENIEYNGFAETEINKEKIKLSLFLKEKNYNQEILNKINHFLLKLPETIILAKEKLISLSNDEKCIDAIAWYWEEFQGDFPDEYQLETTSEILNQMSLHKIIVGHRGASFDYTLLVNNLRLFEVSYSLWYTFENGFESASIET